MKQRKVDVILITKVPHASRVHGESAHVPLPHGISATIFKIRTTKCPEISYRVRGVVRVLALVELRVRQQ